MGFFSKEECCICNGRVGSLNRIKTKDGFICGECSLKCSRGLNFHNINTIDISEHLKYREQNKKEFSDFTPSFSVEPYFYINYETKKWHVSTDNKKRTPDIFRFDDLVNFEYVEDGETLIKSKGTIARAAVGGLLFGGAGAVVGSNTGKSVQKETIKSSYIRISLKNNYVSELKLDFIIMETKKSSITYKNIKAKVESIISSLERIRSENENIKKEESTFTMPVSSAGEIKKFKELLDDGIITQEEFNAKKTQLLGL